MSCLQLNGIGKGHGGIYKSIDINGVYQLDEQVQCESFKAQGIIRADEILVKDSFDLDGICKSQLLKAKRVNFTGIFKNSHTLNCEKLVGSGCLVAKGVIKAKDIQLTGKVKVQGSMESDSLQLNLTDKSFFTELSAENVKIRKEVNHQVRLSLTPRRKDCPLIKGELVEGEDVYLDYCKINYVYGDRIEIGPHCDIEEVEFQESLNIHPTAKVKKQIQREV